MERTALVFGATGLVGTALVNQLLHFPKYTSITLFVRKKIPTTDERINQIVMNFDNLAEVAPLISAHDVYCCLGTTMAKAGSKAAFRRVDYEYPLEIGKIAVKNGVENFTLISSIGATNSRFNFYLRTKYEVETELAKLNFKRFNVVRPSLLLGNRNESRMGEKIGVWMDKVLKPLYFGGMKKYAGIHAETVAKAMIRITLSDERGKIYESDELQQIGNS